MERTIRWIGIFIIPAALLASGCANSSHADRGALFGGLLGAGTGAIVGSAVHNPGAGAAIGAGVGAISGAAIGAGQDEVEANNRAMIESQLGRPIGVGSVTVPDVVAMTQARVHEDLIINHIHSHGMAAPPTANDLIYLSQQGVSPRVVQVMQEPPPVRPQTQTVIVQEAPPPPAVVIGGYYGPRPYWHPHHRCYW
jgi:hypothetical protein